MRPTKLENYVDWMHTLEKHVVDFHDTGFYDGFKPYRERLTVENGTYLTIRCGLGGIYTVINEMKDNHWQVECLDGSTTIAYRPLKDEEKFNETTDYEVLRRES